MSSIGALVRHSLRRRRGFLAAIVLVLFLFQFLLIGAGRALYLSGMFSNLGQFLPEFMQGFVNTGAMSFRGMVSFGYSHPVVELFLIAMAIAIASEPATEIETKFIDVLMARPVRRITLVSRSVILLLLCTAGTIGSMLVGTVIGLRLFTPAGADRPSAQLIASMALNLACLVLAWGAIALLIASMSKRQSSVTSSCGLLAFVTFIVDYVARIWNRLDSVAVLSPFHYYSPFQMLGTNALSLENVFVLLAIFAIASVAANVVYVRRDL
jgi:ABC-type transport system involved in multi-copper enzyme maturation permease subunit